MTRSGQAARFAVLLGAALILNSCSGEDRLPLQLLVPNNSISGLPYVIAYDQGLFEKYGLDLTFNMPRPDTASVADPDRFMNILRRLRLAAEPAFDVVTGGLGPAAIRTTQSLDGHQYLVGIASTDCVLRAHIIAREGITSLEQLKGKRIGVSGFLSTSGLHGQVLAERMDWDPEQDISIITGADDDIGLILDGSVDALIGYERAYADALDEGLPVLSDTAEWNDSLAGNSTRVQAA